MVSTHHDFRENVVMSLRVLKFEFNKRPDELAIPIYQQGHTIGRLRPVHVYPPAEEIRLLMEWRNENREAFFSWFTATEEETEKWLTEQILAREDRILFFIETLDHRPFGHIGLTNFDYSTKACEIDNVLRGTTEFIKGGMSVALQALINWVFIGLRANSIYLRVFSDNQRALGFYTQGGFEMVKQVPFRRMKDGNVTRWVEAREDDRGVFEKYVSYLRIVREKA
jgi:RimJ/RimL family protein N-acetyltransferase